MSKSRLLGYAGCLIPVFLIYEKCRQFGNRWTFGRYGIPRSVLAADCEHYADGGNIDPLTQWLIQCQCEEEFAAFGLLILTGLLGALLWQVRRRRKLLAQLEDLRHRIVKVDQ